MNAMQFQELLSNLDACKGAREWASGKSLRTVWRTCHRGDWLLWLCGKMADKPGWPTHKQVVLAACDCASLALKYVPKGENRPAEVIRITRAWARGRATLAQVKTAAASVSAAYAAASVSAAYAAYAAASAAYAAVAAAAAASAAADDANTRKETLKHCAALVRKRLQPFTATKN